MKLILIILSAFLIAFTLNILPPFIYNELEFGFRKEFSLAYFSLQKAEAAIEVRRAGPGENVGSKDYVAYGEGIEASIFEAIQYLGKAKEFNQKQDKFNFLLGGEYRKYHEMKNAAINEYWDITTQFLSRKQNEHMVTNTLMTIIETQSKIRNIQDEDQWWRTMDSLPLISQTVFDNNNKLKNSGYINDEVFGYFMDNVQSFRSLYLESQKVAASKSWSSFDTSVFDNNAPGKTDVTKIFTDARVKWNEATDAYYVRVEGNNAKLFDASSFYNQNDLAYDKLSIGLSFINHDFPRMKIIENIQPSIIPSSIDPNSISMKF